MPEKKNGRKDADLDQDLRLEVAALASQLGLAASTGGDAGFDDTDFRPSSKAASVNKKVSAAVQSQRHPREPRLQAGKGGQEGNKRSTYGAEFPGEEAQKKLPGRTWNSGIGPRPGDMLSLLS